MDEGGLHFINIYDGLISGIRAYYHFVEVDEAGLKSYTTNYYV